METQASLSSDETMVLTVLIVAAALVLIVWAVAHNWRKLRVAAYQARLRQLMIERGMSAEEIERVLGAGATSGERRWFRPHLAVGIGRGLDRVGGVDDADVKKAKC